MLAGLTKRNSDRIFNAQPVLDSLPFHIAILNGEGTIVFTNAAWQRFAQANGDPDLRRTGVGNNFLVLCQKAAAAQSEGAVEVLRGVQSILNGEAEQFAGECACHSSAQQRWFLQSVSAYRAPQNYALVTSVEDRERLRELSRR